MIDLNGPKPDHIPQDQWERMKESFDKIYKESEEWAMKKWLTTRFLPMWAKETVLRDNESLKKRLARCEQQNKNLKREKLALKDQVRRLQAELNR